MITKLEKISINQTLLLDCGKSLDEICIAYETYGILNLKKLNAILICHALTGDAHAAGKYNQEDDTAGWWDNIIGPNKAIDTNKYFVVCSNILGSCYGTTGTNDINPKTKKPYHIDFPVITVNDMVKVQKKLMDFLKIDSWLSVIGGSLGGMQALQWAITFPDKLKSAIPFATTAQTSSQAIAFNWVGRESIMSDKNFNKGNYSKNSSPERGLAIARMLGHITYLGRHGMSQKFGRRLQENKKVAFDFNYDFTIESYLNYQGKKFVERFDANSYLYITRAMDYFNIFSEKTLKKIKTNLFILSFSSDWLFPPSEVRELVALLQKIGKTISYCQIDSDGGHDSFLLKNKNFERAIHYFLKKQYNKYE